MMKTRLKSVRIKKHLSQNFLVNEGVKERILQACCLHRQDIILEIGPGHGVLTSALISKAKHVTAVEADLSLFRELRLNLDNKKATLIHDDILKVDFTKLQNDVKVIGNLPYHISSPIIEKLIKFHEKIKVAYLTVQLEFGQRLAARPSTKAYGSLSCFIQYFADVEILFKISPSSFKPAPKVTSCFVKIAFRNPDLPAKNEAFLFEMIRLGFSQRRKKLINALSTLSRKQALEDAFLSCDIPLSARAENVPLNKFVMLSDTLK